MHVRLDMHLKNGSVPRNNHNMNDFAKLYPFLKELQVRAPHYRSVAYQTPEKVLVDNRLVRDGEGVMGANAPPPLENLTKNRENPPPQKNDSILNMLFP